MSSAKSADFRMERDTLGQVPVPMDKYWGAQTERARGNFAIGNQPMPIEIVYALAIVKKAAAAANAELSVLAEDKAKLIAQVCEEIIGGRLDDQFPLPVWQTGSGTQTNMNVNEVIANRAHVLAGGKLTDKKKALHPNDDVNRSQSTNDTFPTAMNIAAYRMAMEHCAVEIGNLQTSFADKAAQFQSIIKIGRTHTMDATPLTLGQEFSAFAAQLDHGLSALEQACAQLLELAAGGTAVGTGLNAPLGYAELVVQKIAQLTGYPFKPAPNKFEALASHDGCVRVSGALGMLAVSLTKIANDIRLLASGPRAGLSELILPANEPGSSIMPGKVNPTQIEALTMVCAHVLGNNLAISIAGMQGQFQLNAYKPLIGFSLLTSLRNLADACRSFNEHCLRNLQPNRDVIRRHLENSLMLVTALTPHIGYDKAAEIAKKAHADGSTLREAALLLNYVTAEQFDAWVVPEKMLGTSPSTAS